MSERESLCEFRPGDFVRVKPEHDIPSIFRPNGEPSRGQIDHVLGDNILVVVVEGKSVPYQPHQVERDV